MAEMTSRGADEEKLRAIINLLHTETHIVEAMSKEPERASELSTRLDEIRRLRQQAVAEWAGPFYNVNHWCELKHLLETQRHIEEMIENAARNEPSHVEPLSRMLADVIKEREKLSHYFRSGKISGGTCPRCENDIMPLIFSTKKEEKTKHLNIEPYNKAGGDRMDIKKLGLINGAQVVGEGIHILGEEIDKQLGKDTAPVLERPSTLVDVVGGAAIQAIGAFALRDGSDEQLVAVVAGSNLLARAVSHIKEFATAPKTSLSYQPSVSVIGGAPVAAQPAVMQIAPSVRRIPQFV